MELPRFTSAVEWDPANDLWMKEHAGKLGAVARQMAYFPGSIFPRSLFLIMPSCIFN
jgi:hypothetical protein